jgi:hypothetical protein
MELGAIGQWYRHRERQDVRKATQTSTQIELQPWAAAYTSIFSGVALAATGSLLYHKSESSTSPPRATTERMLCSPMSPRTCCMIITSCPIFVLSTSVRVHVRKWTCLKTALTVPKYPLQANTEAIDLIAPLVSNLMSMVLRKRLHLAQKMFEFSGTETRFLWLIRSPRSRQVRRYERRGNPED